MAATPDGLEALIQGKLDDIALSEEVIQKLVARGISRTSAQRFVDRALVENPPSWTPSRPVPSEPPSAESPSLTDDLRNSAPVAELRAHKNLTRGGIAMAAGIALTLLSFAIGWALIQRERADQRVADAMLANADASRAEQIRAESNAKRETDNRARAARQDARRDEALKQLTSDRSTVQCDAALLLGRSGSPEHVPALVNLLNFADSSSVRICAASALLKLGDTGTALAAYSRWAEGTDGDQRRSAIMGFGEIGPSAAHIALPYLAEALKSPDMNVRYLAVESLAKLGPTAVPLLEVAAGDGDKNVRDRAAAALKGSR